MRGRFRRSRGSGKERLRLAHRECGARNLWTSQPSPPDERRLFHSYFPATTWAAAVAQGGTAAFTLECVLSRKRSASRQAERFQFSPEGRRNVMMDRLHEGELEAQSLARESQMAERTGVLVADRIIGGARPFLQLQSMVVFASQDRGNNLWSSIVFGRPGFMRSQDGYAVDFDLSQVALQGKHPLSANIHPHPPSQFLALSPPTP